MIEELKNRIQKQFKLYQKWAKKEQLSCFRIYHKDLPNYPISIDWIDNDVICWIYNRTRDDTDEKKASYEKNVKESIKEALNISDEQLYIKSRQQQKGLKNQYKKLSHNSKTKIVIENELKFEVNLTDYLDIGLFLDHRKTRQYVKTIAKNKRVLNLFAYTGSFTCYAIAGGALATTSVDLNKNYSKWTENNVRINEFKTRASDRIISDNVFSFLHLEQSKNRYDLIICDPPTFSNSKKMKKTFSVDDDYKELLKLCINLLSKDGILLFSCNSRQFKLNSNKLPKSVTITDITTKTTSFDFKGRNPHQCWEIKKL